MFGAAIVAEQESKIKEREQPVAEVKAKDRRESIKLNRVRASIESLVGETDEQRMRLFLLIVTQVILQDE